MPAVIIQPGQEIAYCVYFRTPNSQPVGIHRWSTATAGESAVVHDLQLYFTRDPLGAPLDFQPPGTFSLCAPSPGNSAVPEWIYDANGPVDALDMPADDGSGHPLATEVGTAAAGYLRVHFRNQTLDPVSASVTVSADALAEGVVYTRTATYVTFNGNLSIPPNAMNFAGGAFDCDAPPGAKIWRTSMHAHKQLVHSEVRDGATAVNANDDWEHPAVTTFAGPAFYTFNHPITYTCTYSNLGDNNARTIHTGESDATDEQCVSIHYFFPATTNHTAFCFNNVEQF
jgi:hypothetical protein